ncbi:MAG: hypothetical protein E7284_07755 [Lachnospiraceae bacterium]|nr:hypothetical protein [Lachnospiraceae bacterium]
MALALSAVLIIIVTFLICLVTSVIINAVLAIPYFIMGRRAGFKHAWIAFIPMLSKYIAVTIPHRSFNLGILKTNNRKIFYWIWLGLTLLISLSYTIFSHITSNAFSALLLNDYEYTTSVYTSPLSVIIVLISLLLFLISSVVLSILCWRINYDLLKTYGLDNHAMWVSVVNIFVPLLMIVFSFIIMNREPDYGYDGYYILENHLE